MFGVTSVPSPQFDTEVSAHKQTRGASFCRMNRAKRDEGHAVPLKCEQCVIGLIGRILTFCVSFFRSCRDHGNQSAKAPRDFRLTRWSHWRAGARPCARQIAKHISRFTISRELATCPNRRFFPFRNHLHPCHPSHHRKHPARARLHPALHSLDQVRDLSA